MNITESLHRLSPREGNLDALILPESIINYRTLENHVTHLCYWLTSRNIKPPHRVALIISNELLLAIIIIACARIGVTFLTIPRSASKLQQKVWCNRAEISFLIKDDRHISIPGISSFYLDQIPEHIATAENKNESYLINQHPDLLMIIIGSGSTGQPKLIPITQAQMLERAKVINEAYEFTPQDRIATMAHLEYTAAITRLFASLETKAAFVIMNRHKFDLPSLNKIYGITRLSATVFHVQHMLIEAKNYEEPALGNIHLSISSSPVSDHLRHEIIKKLTPNLWIAYGTNEVWTTTLAKPKDVLMHPQTVGTLAPGAKVKIVDQNFEELPPNSIGLICIQARGAVNHYLNEKQTDMMPFQGEWFIPKDFGMMTADGHLIFYGRSDNLMIFNGINIYPAEIENCLADHECVLEVVAIPWSDPVHHQIPVAIVSVCSPTSEDELMRFCEKILGFRAPQRIFIVPKLNRNKQGKITQETLAQLIREIGDPSRATLEH